MACSRSVSPRGDAAALVARAGPVGGRQGDQADDYREDRVVDHPGDPADYGGAYLDDRGVEDYSWCFPVQMPIRI